MPGTGSAGTRGSKRRLKRLAGTEAQRALQARLRRLDILKVMGTNQSLKLGSTISDSISENTTTTIMGHARMQKDG